MASYNRVPVLAKIKIGNQTYWMKDQDAREAINSLESSLASYATIEYVDGKIAAEVSRADLKYATAADLTAAIARVAALEATVGDASSGLVKGLADEISRATAAEGVNATAISNETSRATAAEGGLDKRIEALEGRGRYLSGWNAATGIPTDYPQIPEGATSPYTYTYKAGDYYIVSNVPASGTVYMPDGGSITATKSGTTWTWEVGKKETTDELTVNDNYIYSSSAWTLFHTPTKEVVWGSIGGDIEDQSDLQTALAGKVDVESGKRLMTDAEGTKLAGIEAGAQVNKIEKITVNGTEQTITSKTVAITDMASASALTALTGRVTTAEGDIDALESGKVDKVTGKGLSTNDYTTDEKNKLAGIEAGAQVNKIESIKVNGSVKTITDKQIDLGSIATADDTVTGVQYVDASHKLQAKKGAGEYVDVHTFGALAEKSSATGTVAGQTITGVKASGTTTGSVSGDLAFTDTAITSTGKVTATGGVTVTLKNNQVSEITSVGTLPEWTAGSFSGGKATVVDVTKFNGGSVATFSEGAFTAATLTHSEDTFAKEGIKAHVGVAAQEEDTECLYFETVSTGTASNITAFSGGSKAADTFNGGTVASLSAGFVTAGSDASCTMPSYVAGTLPTMADKTVGVQSAVFAGDEVDVSVNGSYKKAGKGTLAFTGASVELDVGNIVVSDKDVTVA